MLQGLSNSTCVQRKRQKTRKGVRIIGENPSDDGLKRRKIHRMTAPQWENPSNDGPKTEFTIQFTEIGVTREPSIATKGKIHWMTAHRAGENEPARVGEKRRLEHQLRVDEAVQRSAEPKYGTLLQTVNVIRLQ